jgi:hypothetical protein
MFRLCRAIIRPVLLVIRYGSVVTKRPDDGSVELKHVTLDVLLTINWMCLTDKMHTLYIFRNTSE